MWVDIPCRFLGSLPWTGSPGKFGMGWWKSGSETVTSGHFNAGEPHHTLGRKKKRKKRKLECLTCFLTGQTFRSFTVFFKQSVLCLNILCCTICKRQREDLEIALSMNTVLCGERFLTTAFQFCSQYLTNLGDCWFYWESPFQYELTKLSAFPSEGSHPVDVHL